MISWTSLIGQTHLAALLRRTIVERRLPQALLLVGPPGVGKVALALAYTTAMMCERPAAGDAGAEPCGQCASCRQMATLQHPDLRIVMALPAGKGDTDRDMKTETVDDVRTVLQQMAEDPYTTARVEGASQIRIGQIRELKRLLSLSASQNPRRVVLIVDAETMTTEASNAFLKTLEEPHDDVTIILTSSRPERLLPTIASRCQVLSCPPLDDLDIADAMVRRGFCDASEARLVASFSNGSWSQARDYLSEDMRAYREDAVSLLRAALKARDFRPALVELLQPVIDGRNKRRMEFMATLMLLWLRDAHALAYTAEAPIVNVDQRDALQRFADGFGVIPLDRIADVVDQAVRNVHRNVTPILVFLPMMLRLRSILNATRAARHPRP